MNVQVRIFQALGDPVRLRIVESMRLKERAVGDICERVDIHQSGVSRHLRILAGAGLVQMRPDGQKRLYSFARKLSISLKSGWQDIAATGRRASTGWVLPWNTANLPFTPTLRRNHEQSCTCKLNAQFSIERTYAASILDVWQLWTTKSGIEPWWGPEGFDVRVTSIDLRQGGQLVYWMTATAPQQVAFMKQNGMPLSTECKVTYTEVSPPHRLT